MISKSAHHKVYLKKPFNDRKGNVHYRVVVKITTRKPKKLYFKGPIARQRSKAAEKKKRKQQKLKFPIGHLRPKGKRGGMQFHFDTYKGERILYSHGNPDPSADYDITQLVPSYINNLYNINSVGGDLKHPNPQSFTHYTETSSYGDIHTAYSNGSISGAKGWGLGTAFIAPPDLDRATAYNNALSKMFDKVRGDVDHSINVGEAHKTVDGVKKAFKALTHIVTTFRKMRRSNPRDWGNLWLEFHYGWAPLAKDLYETAERLVKPSRTKGFYNEKGTGITSQTVQEQRTDSNGVPCTTVATADVRVLIKCQYNYANTTLDQLSGFTSLNPVSIAWELTPYSFVVDWFINVGGYMRNLESSYIYSDSFIGGFVTTTSEQTTGYSVSYSKARDDGSNAVDVYQYVGGTTVTRTKLRQVLGDNPVPSLPIFKPNLGWSRAASGSALLGQHLDSLKKESLLLEGILAKTLGKIPVYRR
jgi:hypothetical protein